MTKGEGEVPLGLMEVKPPHASQKMAEIDRQKIIDGLICIFSGICERLKNQDLLAQIVLVGIVAHGINLFIPPFS